MGVRFDGKITGTSSPKRWSRPKEKGGKGHDVLRNFRKLKAPSAVGVSKIQRRAEYGMKGYETQQEQHL